MKFLKAIPKLLVCHPVWGGLAIEGVLVLLFWFFPAGACNTPLVGVTVLYAHYPAILFVERVLGLPYSAIQFFTSAALMAVLWIGVLFVMRWLFASRIKP